MAPNRTPHTDARERRALHVSVGARRWAWTLDAWGGRFGTAVLIGEKVDGIDWGRVIGKALAAGFLVLIIFLAMWLWKIAKRTGKKGLEIGKQALDQAKDRMDGIPDSGGRYDALYAIAYEEIQSANMESASWAKAFAHASGEQDKARALYIKYRVEQLKRAKPR